MAVASGDSDRLVFLREVATGPMSTVYVAERRVGTAKRLVAVKVLTRRVHRDTRILLGLRDRARQLAAIGHRHVVCIEDVARVGDRLALVQPWADGVDALDWVEVLSERDERVPGRVACEIVQAAATALDAALNLVPPGADAGLGLVHRDVKPTNLLLAHDGELKVLDFGTGYTSIAGRGARAGVLQKGLVKYLAPERREGKRGGPPADVYALGVIAIELLRGRWLRRLHGQNPAHDRYLAEVVARLDGMQMRTPTDDRTLRNTLLRMVAFDPDARPAASEIALTLRTLGDRAFGPSLAAFAPAHVLPWIQTVPSRPDPGVEQPPTHFLGDVEAEDLDDRAPVSADTPVAREPEPFWEETDAGWRLAAALEEEETDDEDPTYPTPPAAAPRVHGFAALPTDELPVPFTPAPPERTVTVTAITAPGASRRPSPVRPGWVALGLAAAIGALGGMSFLALALAIWWTR